MQDSSHNSKDLLGVQIAIIASIWIWTILEAVKEKRKGKPNEGMENHVEEKIAKRRKQEKNEL